MGWRSDPYALATASEGTSLMLRESLMTYTRPADTRTIDVREDRGGTTLDPSKIEPIGEFGWGLSAEQQAVLALFSIAASFKRIADALEKKDAP